MDYGPVVSAPVGRGGGNTPEDVRLVQRLLNDASTRDGGKKLKVDGIAGPLTNAAILQYQNKHGLPPDGRIDPGGRTIKDLLDAHLASLQNDLISPYIVRGALDSVPELDDRAISSTVRDYIASLRS